MSSLQGILERKNRRKETLQSALNLIVNQLREMGALRIIIFGSLATGEVDVNSDIDILVVMPETQEGRSKRLPERKQMYENESPPTHFSRTSGHWGE